MLVVVGAEPGKARAARRLVERLGGDVGQRLPIVHGFTARVPSSTVERLHRAPFIRTVARDVELPLLGAPGVRPGHDHRRARRAGSP